MFSSNKNVQGSVGEMAAVALPMVVSFGCETAMIFTDRLFLAQLGSQSMSAAMAGGLSVFVMMSFFFGLISYTTALVAQYFGAGEKPQCSRALSQSVIVAVLAYPAMLALVPAAHWLFLKSGIDALQLNEQGKYFNILIYGSLFNLARHAFSSFFTGIGRTRLVMAASALALTVNVILNYILIFGKLGVPALGIQGAALGTVLSSACSTIFLLAKYLSTSVEKGFEVRANCVFDRAVMAKLWRYGCPGGVEMVFNLAAFTAMVFVLHSRGTVAAAATTVVFNWDMVTYVPLLGIEVGVMSLVGRYMGAQKFDVVKRVVVSGLKMGMVYSLFMIALFGFLPIPLVEMFKPPVLDGVFADAQPLAVAMVKLVALYVSAQAVLMVFIGSLRGAGDTVWAMRISVGIHWILLLVLVLMLNVWQSSVYQAWFGLIVVFMALAALPYLRYRTGRWQDIRVISPETT